MERRRARRRGLRAETLCCWWLRLKGYRILARQFRTPVGELDIVARRGRLLAIVEVKARDDFAAAAYAITPRQQRRIVRATEAFLQRRPDLAKLQPRFDAMLVMPRRPPHHIMNAWRP
jgi:putative endonuclease